MKVSDLVGTTIVRAQQNDNVVNLINIELSNGVIFDVCTDDLMDEMGAPLEEYAND